MSRQPLDLNDALIDIIEAHTLEHGYPPSIAYMARAVKAGPATVHKRLGQLVAEGRIVKEAGRARAIRIIRKD
jgi:SOS-response transcriptional repressor LexA